MTLCLEPGSERNSVVVRHPFAPPSLLVKGGNSFWLTRQGGNASGGLDRAVLLKAVVEAIVLEHSGVRESRTFDGLYQYRGRSLGEIRTVLTTQEVKIG